MCSTDLKTLFRTHYPKASVASQDLPSETAGRLLHIPQTPRRVAALLELYGAVACLALSMG